MPSKNIIKTYIENGYYHIYNRGVEKRDIFLDEQDYRVFLSYLKIYLSPQEESVKDIKNNNNSDYKDKNKILSEIYTLNNFFNKIDLICYVLMPNHFHLELRQTNKKDIEIFMRSLITKYSKYFNKKYERVGPLFQGRYKAILIQSIEYLLHLSRYIHLNPLNILNHNMPLIAYPWSSYQIYVNDLSVNWLKKELIITNFIENGVFSISLYKNFVENYENYIEESKRESNAYKDILLD
jgi:putative transposase